MRGKLDYVAKPQPCAGITPADAGKTHLYLSSVFCAQDHPRGCGENVGLTAYRRGSVGSPPRMRGKLERVAFIFAQARITPADAGKTDYRA